MTLRDADPSRPPDSFHAHCGRIGLELEPAELERLGRFVELLLETNKHTNLTGARDPAEVWTRHIFDALTLIAILESVGSELEILDIGSGGGLPAVPLAIVRPDDRFTMLEATGKKCDFLEAAIEDLELRNARVLRGRAEAFGHDRGDAVDIDGERTRTGGHRERYDVVTSRAVGRVAVISELAVPFAKVGGLVVLVKGEQADTELTEAKAALHLLHTAPAGVIETPTGRLVVLEKLRITPRTYPRADGEPKRSPLGVKAERPERRP